LLPLHAQRVGQSQQRGRKESPGKENTEEEVDYAAKVLQKMIAQLRRISSQWNIVEREEL